MKTLLGSTSHDSTWRLWDVAAEKEVLLQEGHSSGTYGIAFHPDGSLVATSDLGGCIRLWDMRTGRTVMPLQGHNDQVLALDFNANGTFLASGGNDNTVKTWDLRRRKCVSTIPAHNKAICDIRFAKPRDTATGNVTATSSNFFVTASYDKTLKLWNANNYQCVKVLQGHEARVMACDMAVQANEKDPVNGVPKVKIGSVAFDRTFKLWMN